MAKQDIHSGPHDSTRQAEAPQGHAGPVLFDGQSRYCMRCGKRHATHIKFSAQGRKQYRCDDCHERRRKTEPVSLVL